jgi:predicted transcriptional regulator
MYLEMNNELSKQIHNFMKKLENHKKIKQKLDKKLLSLTLKKSKKICFFLTPKKCRKKANCCEKSENGNPG